MNKKSRLEIRRPEIMSIIGSRFWKVNNERSDYDIIKVQFPLREDLYENYWIRGKVEEGNQDIMYVDIRDFLIKLNDGKLQYFEALYSDNTSTYDHAGAMIYTILQQYRNIIFNSVRRKIMRNAYYEIKNRLKGFSEENDNYLKEAVHLLKLTRIFMISEIGGNPFEQNDGFRIDMKNLKKIRSGFLSNEEITKRVLEECENIIEVYEKKYLETDKEVFKNLEGIMCPTLSNIRVMVQIVIRGMEGESYFNTDIDNLNSI